MGTAQTHLIRIGALAVASATALGTAAGVAGAATGSSGSSGNSGQSTAAPAGLSGLKAKANQEVKERVDALNAAIGKANTAKGLGSGQATLVSYLGTDIAPLQQLNTTIQGDTTYKQALADFKDIFSNFRVYVLVLPAAAIAGDAFRDTATVLPNLTTDSQKAQQHVNPKNQASLQPLINDLNTQITTASNATNGLATTVLAYMPPQWNANHNLLAAAKGQDEVAHTAIQRARADVQAIVQILKGPGFGPNATSSTGSDDAAGGTTGGTTNGTTSGGAPGTGTATGVHLGHLGRLGRAGTTTTTTA
jgi:hypothetical protein